MFIVFEGIDGVGKSSHMRGLSQFLVEKGITHVRTSEFGNLNIGRSFKNIIVNHDLTGEEELSVICALRSYHSRNVLQPAIKQGHWILMDRFIESTWAYQHGAKNVSKNMLQTFMSFFDLPEPDLTILLDGNNHRSHKGDKFDEAGKDFVDKVKKVYEDRCQNNWLRYNTNLGYKTVQSMMRDDINNKFLSK